MHHGLIYNFTLSASTYLISDYVFENTTFNYTLNLNYSFKKFTFFAERYGVFHDSYFGMFVKSYFDFGAAYLINNNLQADFYFGGFDESSYSNKYFYSIGLSYRLKTKKDE
ncbi:MAG: hypothetical protein Kow0079_12550 [Vicingaceae bacterium]